MRRFLTILSIALVVVAASPSPSWAGHRFRMTITENGRGPVMFEGTGPGTDPIGHGCELGMTLQLTFSRGAIQVGKSERFLVTSDFRIVGKLPYKAGRQPYTVTITCDGHRADTMHVAASLSRKQAALPDTGLPTALYLIVGFGSIAVGSLLLRIGRRRPSGTRALRAIQVPHPRDR